VSVAGIPGANIASGGLIGADHVGKSGVWGVSFDGLTVPVDPVPVDPVPDVVRNDSVLWLDAADLSTITESSGNVSQWNDKTSNNNHVIQGTGANQPDTGTRTIGGLNALDFNGSSDQLERLTNTLLVGANGTYTVFAVVETDTIAAGTRMILYQDTGSPRLPQFLRLSAATPQSILFVSTTPITDSGQNVTANVATVLTAVCSISAVEVFKDGGTNGSTAVSGSITSRAEEFSVGGRSTDYFNGLIGELIVIPFAVTSGQRQDVETYLTDKWSI
jgi:hypothetical protein